MVFIGMINNSNEVKKWKEDRGDYTLRLNYPLNKNSVVLDLGGYLGSFTTHIYDKYNCNIFIFEPVKLYYNDLCYKFKDIPKIKVFNYAIAGTSKSFQIVYNRDATYLKPSFTNNEQIKSFKEIYDDLNLNTIDLLKINVEGAEYDIMNNIFENNLVKKINNFQIQFHYTFSNSEKLLQDIRQKLSETHKLTWNYKWVWENWEKI